MTLPLVTYLSGVHRAPLMVCKLSTANRTKQRHDFAVATISSSTRLIDANQVQPSDLVQTGRVSHCNFHIGIENAAGQLAHRGLDPTALRAGSSAAALNCVQQRHPPVVPGGERRICGSRPQARWRATCRRVLAGRLAGAMPGQLAPRHMPGQPTASRRMQRQRPMPTGPPSRLDQAGAALHGLSRRLRSKQPPD